MKTPGEIFIDQVKHNPAMQMAVVAAGASALRQQREQQEAIRREAEAARKETEAMRKEIERMRQRAEKAEEAEKRARERAEKLSQDRDIVFGMAKQIESLAARPLGSSQEVSSVRYEYQQHANTLSRRSIGLSTFERFEDKEFYTRLKQQMDELGQRIAKECARIDAEEQRAVVIESIAIFDRIAGALVAQPLLSPQEARAIRDEYQQHKKALKRRGIGISTFESFEDKELYSRFKQQMDELGERITRECARADTEEKRALVAESISIVERIGSEEASPASYLKLEKHAAHFAEKGITADSFTDASDRALVQHYEQIVAAEQARQLDGMPRESFAAMSELKSWLRLGRVLAQHRPREIRAADDIERCKKQLSSIPVPESPKSFYEVALRTPRFVAPVAIIVVLWFVVLVLVILQRTGGENAHYGTGIVLGFLISGLTTFLLVAILSPFQTVSMKVGEMQVDFASTQKRTKRLLSQLEDLQRAKAEGARKFGEALAEATGIAGETLKYAAGLTFPSAESKEFQKSAEAYCEHLRTSLGIHQSMIPVLESAAAIPG